MLHSFFRWLRVWGPVAFIYTGITILSHQAKLPGPENITAQFFWFKLGHIVVYATLGWFVYRGFFLSQTQNSKHAPNALWKRSLILVAILATIDEAHQSFIPGRGPHIRDVLIDLGGASAAVLWCHSRYNRDARNRNKDVKL